MNQSSEDMEENLFVEGNDIKIIHNILKTIKEYQFNINNFSDEKFFQIKEEIKKKIKENKEIIELFKFLVHLWVIDGQFIVCKSNSLNLLVEMKIDLKSQQLENIKIQNALLIGADFVRCNLS
ncbi:unnamed protein product [Paramecium sonneborni]|uniref:Uncharacterized protein n=1 Tax=Paramecium sonneborni TaxID=65129 RepID=A0A8S1P3N0_9CILI|nr:unnamed protein product [Paramecium sonneborni]